MRTYFPSHSIAEKRLIFQDAPKGAPDATGTPEGEKKIDTKFLNEHQKKAIEDLKKSIAALESMEKVDDKGKEIFTNAIKSLIGEIVKAGDIDAAGIKTLYETKVLGAAKAYAAVLEERHSGKIDIDKKVAIGNDLRTLFKHAFTVEFSLDKGVTSVTTKEPKKTTTSDATKVSPKAAKGTPADKTERGEATADEGAEGREERINELKENLKDKFAKSQVKDAVEGRSPQSQEVRLTFLKNGHESGLIKEDMLRLLQMSDEGIAVLSGIISDKSINLKNLSGEKNGKNAAKVFTKLSGLTPADEGVFKKEYLKSNKDLIALYDKAKGVAVVEGWGKAAIDTLESIWKQLEPLLVHLEKFMKDAQPYIQRFADVQKRIDDIWNRRDPDRASDSNFDAQMDERDPRRVKDQFTRLDTEKKELEKTDYEKEIPKVKSSKVTVDAAVDTLKKKIKNHKIVDLTEEERKQQKNDTSDLEKAEKKQKELQEKLDDLKAKQDRLETITPMYNRAKDVYEQLKKEGAYESEVNAEAKQRADILTKYNEKSKEGGSEAEFSYIKEDGTVHILHPEKLSAKEKEALETYSNRITLPDDSVKFTPTDTWWEGAKEHKFVAAEKKESTSSTSVTLAQKQKAVDVMNAKSKAKPDGSQAVFSIEGGGSKLRVTSASALPKPFYDSFAGSDGTVVDKASDSITISPSDNWWAKTIKDYTEPPESIAKTNPIDPLTSPKDDEEVAKKEESDGKKKAKDSNFAKPPETKGIAESELPGDSDKRDRLYVQEDGAWRKRTPLEYFRHGFLERQNSEWGKDVVRAVENEGKWIAGKEGGKGEWFLWDGENVWNYSNESESQFVRSHQNEDGTVSFKPSSEFSDKKELSMQNAALATLVDALEPGETERSSSDSDAQHQLRQLWKGIPTKPTKGIPIYFSGLDLHEYDPGMGYDHLLVKDFYQRVSKDPVGTLLELRSHDWTDSKWSTGAKKMIQKVRSSVDDFAKHLPTNKSDIV